LPDGPIAQIALWCTHWTVPVQRAAVKRRSSFFASRSTCSGARRVLAQPQVRARLIVIERIQSQDPSQMPFAIDQDLIQALAPECPDQALNIWILPGRSRAVAYPHRPKSTREGLPVCAVIVAHQIGRCCASARRDPYRSKPLRLIQQRPIVELSAGLASLP
jgi:hypothetical protein